VTQSLIVTPEALKHAPWSFSKVETGEACPAQFKHKHLLRTQAGPAAPDTVVGTAAHGILERRVGGASLVKARKAALMDTPLTSDELDMLRALEDRIETFVRKFDAFCRREGVTKILVEEPWGITTTYEATGFFAKDVFFRGKIDLGAMTRSGDLVVIDHKSGVAKNLERDQKKKEQLWSYYALAIPNMPDVSGIRGAIHFLQGAEDDSIQWMKSYEDASRVREVHAPWLFSRINTIAGKLVEPFLARPKRRWPCDWCAYRTSCTPFQEAYGGQEG